MIYQLIVGMSRPQKQVIFSLIDAGMIACAFVIAIALESSVQVSSDTLLAERWLLLGLMIGGAGLSWWFGLPRIKLNAYEMRGVIRTAAFAASLGFGGSLASLVVASAMPPGVFFIFSLLTLVLCATWRIVLR